MTDIGRRESVLIPLLPIIPKDLSSQLRSGKESRSSAVQGLSFEGTSFTFFGAAVQKSGAEHVPSCPSAGMHIYKPYPDRTEAGNQSISLARGAVRSFPALARSVRQS
ncbi:hypothetical protein AVEN_144357-1 [Araneus ventricosus]|uniref:Uncharacterized protein n=1 Tax=Araneus ventricosus TaxID=182803 RepID=A0A4Y2RBW4_ARAVE|nr:hypothetical protein AVEN_144357-1 [Araneus ventricosus]